MPATPTATWCRAVPVGVRSPRGHRDRVQVHQLLGPDRAARLPLRHVGPPPLRLLDQLDDALTDRPPHRLAPPRVGAHDGDAAPGAQQPWHN